jgi:hypothetical protein
MPQEKISIFWKVIVSVILGKKLCMFMCTIPKIFRDTIISLYISKIVHKKEILRTVSDTGIYCSNEKVGTVYIVYVGVLISLWLFLFSYLQHNQNNFSWMG